MKSWPAGTGATLDSEPEAPRGLFKRLQYIAGIIRDAGRLPCRMQLVLRLPSGTIRIAPIGDELVVGRGSLCGLIIPDPRMSARHFRIRRIESDALLDDLESRNGSYVNGKRTCEYELRNGDIIEAGGQAFVFLRE